MEKSEEILGADSWYQVSRYWLWSTGIWEMENFGVVAHLNLHIFPACSSYINWAGNNTEILIIAGRYNYRNMSTALIDRRGCKYHFFRYATNFGGWGEWCWKWSVREVKCKGSVRGVKCKGNVREGKWSEVKREAKMKWERQLYEIGQESNVKLRWIIRLVVWEWGKLQHKLS